MGNHRMSRRAVARTVGLMLVLALAIGGSALACTGIRLTAKDGTVVVGRTLEFGQDLLSKVIVVPAGTAMTGTVPSGKGIAYTAKYGFVGANAFGLPIVVDGLNDQGLYVGLFYFPGYADYTPFTAANASKSMAGYEYGAWILANFASVAEFKKAYNSVMLVPTIVPQMGFAPPAHFRIVDKTGAAVVVEPLNGTLKIYDDPLGVLTNAPTFDWHMTNLSNYANLSAQMAKPVTTGGITINSFGQGSGGFGLPGDFTPPSRFVRAVAFQQTAIQSDTGADAVQQLFHILNNFDIPFGAVRDTVEGHEVNEYTLWTSGNDLKHLVFYYRTFTDQTLRSVDVSKALAASGGKIKQYPMDSGKATPIVPAAL
jgi:choloylglycine hydrolase